jgi:hypothetical protein
MGVGGQYHASAALPPGKTRYPMYRRLGGPQGRSGQLRKISHPQKFDPRTVQPVTSRYTNWGIPAPVHKMSTKYIALFWVTSKSVQLKSYSTKKCKWMYIHTFHINFLVWLKFGTTNPQMMPFFLNSVHWIRLCCSYGCSYNYTSSCTAWHFASQEYLCINSAYSAAVVHHLQCYRCFLY